MLSNEKINELTAIGFSRWTKNGMDRLYINASKLGLTCCYYNTGNISSAEFNGRSISNSEARRMKAAKTYIDLVKNQIVSDNSDLATAVADILGIDDYRGDSCIISIA